MSQRPRVSRPEVPSLWELLGLGDPDAVAWVADAVCAQTDPDAFFPERGESTALAKATCVGCPVRAECLAWALDQHEVHGVWGGLSPRERRALLRRRAVEPRGDVAA
jgi:WhiB family transcriptional regulator, redox-sensing transcriptional regulator